MDTFLNIIVDHRESASEVVAHLKSSSKISIVLQSLSAGDYQFENKILFERKTLNDFARSILDGRLFSQAKRLISCPTQRSAILLEGTSASLTKTGISREAMQGAMIMLSITLGIPILRSISPEESAKLMIYTANQLNYRSNLPIERQIKRPKGKKKIQFHILQSLPEVGPVRATLLLKRFGSVAAVMNASIKELREVPGLGEKIAQRIYWAKS